MSKPMMFTDSRLETLDDVEIDRERERADIVLDRPPLNIIEMPQRDQLRLVFEMLDDDPGVRIIVLRAVGEHFSSGGNIQGFLGGYARACLQACMEHCRTSALLQACDCG